MNETKRVSLERHLRKVFPDIEHLSVQRDENSDRFYIKGEHIIDRKFEVWREAERYMDKNGYNFKEWGEPFRF